MNAKLNKGIFIGYFCAIACEIIYGFSFIFSKKALLSASILACLGWRFLIAFLAMTILALLGIIDIKFKGLNIKSLLLIALLNPTLYFITENMGLKLVTVSETAVILACLPAACLLASTIILGKRPHKKRIFGVFISIVGVITSVISAGLSSSFSFLGYAMLIIAVISYALYSVLVEGNDELSPGEISYFMAFIGAIVFSLLALIEAKYNGQVRDLLALPFTDKNFLIATLYQALGSSVLAATMVNVALEHIGVNRTSSFAGISTAISILAGVIIMGDDFSLGQLLGVIAIISGVYIANSKLSLAKLARKMNSWL